MKARSVPWLFLAPFGVLFCITLAYPLARSVWLAFHQTAGPGVVRFVGFDNFTFLAADALFWLALANTVGFGLVYVAVQLPVSFGLALLLNRRGMPCVGLLRLCFFGTFLVGGVFTAVLFSMLLSGLLTDLLNRPNLVMPAVLLCAVWLNAGYGMVYFLAGLQQVDPALLDAAAVDGAGPWRITWHVTLVQLRSVAVFLLVVGGLFSLQLFELPFVLLQGPGPGYRGLTVVMYLVHHGFEVGDLGMAAAVGWALTLLVGLVAVLPAARLTREAA
ncbi:MAG: carbohydrate ABC transporter permease [Phycisphaerae bacterium]